MTTEDVVARFKDARRSGAGWAARCPAHDDRRASLNITKKPDRTLLHCHAGCTPEAVAGAAGLALADLFADAPSGTGIGIPFLVAEYDYTDEAGNLLYQVLRYAPKDFRQRRPAGAGRFVWSLGDVRRVPYRLAEVLQAVQTGRLVFIVEGEKDADRLRACGLVATCNSGGAGARWADDLTEYFRDARLVILPDNDAAGHKHALEVATKLTGIAAEVRLVELPGLSEKGDVSDWLDGSGTVEDLKRLVQAAPLWSPDTVPDGSTGTGQDISSTLPRLRTLAAILSDPGVMRKPQPVIPRLAYAERITLLSAREKEGKSTLASAGAAAVSDRARFLGEMGLAGPVLWVGLEEHPGDTAQRFQSFGAHADRVFVLDALERPFEDLRFAVEQTGAVLVVVDTLSRFAETLVRDASSSTEWTPVMAGLARIARDTGAAVLLLHHARKDGGYRDSTAIGAGVDAIFEMTAGDDGTTRRVKGRGRWAIEEFSVRLEGDRYSLAGGDLSLDTRVMLFVKSNPGCSMRQLRDGVSGKGALVDAAARQLLETGVIEDRGDATGKKLHLVGRDMRQDAAKTEGVSPENLGDTRRDTVAGHSAEEGCVPVAMPRGPDRDTPLVDLEEQEIFEL